jgi:hypothetical protein
MPRSIPASQFFLPLSAVSLGRFVTSLDNPHRDFHEPTSIVNPNCTEKVHKQLDSLEHSVKYKNFGSHLTRFLSSSFTKRLEASVRITADQAKTYHLIDAGDWLQDATRFEETRKWIERTIHEGKKIYFVVGCHTLVNARIVEQLEGQSSAGGTLAVPVLIESGVVVPFDMADHGIGASSGGVEDEDEQIYAVEYRRVNWSWFSEDKVDETTLQTKSWWKEYYEVRTFQSEPEDALEVGLENEIVLEFVRLLPQVDTYLMPTGA